MKEVLPFLHLLSLSENRLFIEETTKKSRGLWKSIWKEPLAWRMFYTSPCMERKKKIPVAIIRSPKSA